MPDDYPSLSLRLPPATSKALEAAARAQGRTRSAIAKEILEKHFAAMEDRRAKIERLIALGGSGATATSFKSGAEVDAFIRHVRGDD